MLTSQQHGVHKQVTLTNSRTLHYASYHIRTEMGLSETSHTLTDDAPIYGTGQDSGNYPMIWFFCPASCIHVTILKLTQQSTPILTVVATNQVSLLMIGFVDDSNGQVNMFQEEDTIEVLSLMHSKARKTQQHGRNYWELPAAL